MAFSAISPQGHAGTDRTHWSRLPSPSAHLTYELLSYSAFRSGQLLFVYF